MPHFLGCKIRLMGLMKQGFIEDLPSQYRASIDVEDFASYE
jgi:hypothetical protein